MPSDSTPTPTLTTPSTPTPTPNLALTLTPTPTPTPTPPQTGEPAPLVSEDVHAIVMAHAERLNSAIIYDRDFEYDYFGFKTLERSYLLKLHGKVRI